MSIINTEAGCRFEVQVQALASQVRRAESRRKQDFILQSTNIASYNAYPWKGRDRPTGPEGSRPGRGRSYYAHYRSLVRIAALLVGNGATAEELARTPSSPCTARGGSCGTGTRPWVACAGPSSAGARGQSVAWLDCPADRATGRARAGSTRTPALRAALRPSRPPARGARPQVLRGLARSPDRRRDGDQQTCGERLHPARHGCPPGPPRSRVGGAPVRPDRVRHTISSDRAAMVAEDPLRGQGPAPEAPGKPRPCPSSPARAGGGMAMTGHWAWARQ